MNHSLIGVLGTILAMGISGTIGYVLLQREQKKN